MPPLPVAPAPHRHTNHETITYVYHSFCTIPCPRHITHLEAPPRKHSSCSTLAFYLILVLPIQKRVPVSYIRFDTFNNLTRVVATLCEWATFVYRYCARVTDQGGPTLRQYDRPSYSDPATMQCMLLSPFLINWLEFSHITKVVEALLQALSFLEQGVSSLAPNTE